MIAPILIAGTYLAAAEPAPTEQKPPEQKYIKDSPPHFHDGRLLNLILEDHLTQGEKDDLLAFLLAL